MTIATDCEIIFDRETKDYAGYLFDSLVGFYPSYVAAETGINALRHELLQAGMGMVGDATLPIDAAQVADATPVAACVPTDTLTVDAFDGWTHDSIVHFINLAISKRYDANPTTGDIDRLVNAFAQCGTFDVTLVRADLYERWGLASTNDDDTLTTEVKPCHGWVIDNGEDDYAFGIEIAEAGAAQVADATMVAADEDTDTLTCPCPYSDPSFPTDFCPCRYALEQGASHVVFMDEHGHITTLTSGNGNGGGSVAAIVTGDGWRCSACGQDDEAQRHPTNLMYCTACYALWLAAVGEAA